MIIPPTRYVNDLLLDTYVNVGFTRMKQLKTSAVSTTDGWFKLNFEFCKLRDMSDTLIGRACRGVI